jgi:hypothetical protein
MARATRMSDETLLELVRHERANSIGMDYDDELQGDRERALQYYKGDMPDMQPGPNRSKVVDTAVADVVETVMPDLMEIFTGGEDVLTFVPRGVEDEDAARQETDYLTYQIFQKNRGWMTIYSGFKDALLSKVGVFKFWWEDEAEYDAAEEFRHKTQEEVAFLAMTQPELEIIEIEPEEAGEGEYASAEPMAQTFRFKARKKVQDGKLCIAAVAPEDFTVAADTVNLADATYCAMRTRVRAQDLIAQGYDRELVDRLSDYGRRSQEAVELARDTANEGEKALSSQQDYQLRTVEIVEHYIRVDTDGDGQPEIWRIVTGEDEQVLLEKDQRDIIEFASICPFPTAHRFYGLSLADKLLEVQRIKTALLRMMLDSGYFAINARHEISEDQASETTFEDLMKNQPGFPVRSRTGTAVRPIGAAQLGFDPYMALEYVSAMAEQRTGVVRNAQGLNPDTLHETAKGAIALMGMAQKRVRMIARIFAETGVKDLYLGVHHLLRKHATMQDKFRLRGSYVPIDPTSWGSRKDMEIQIGVGSGGRDQRMAAFGRVLERMALLQEGGGELASIAPPDRIYQALLQEAEAMGIKGPERFYQEPQPVQEGQDPEAMKAQAEAQAKMMEAQQKAQIEQMKAQLKAQVDVQIAEMRAQADMMREMMREQGKAEQRAIETELAELRLELEALLKKYSIDMKSEASVAMSDFNPGGAIDR